MRPVRRSARDLQPFRVEALDIISFLSRQSSEIDQGVTEFEEVGPGNVLTKLVAQIRRR